jgi:hypothetical protein
MHQCHVQPTCSAGCSPVVPAYLPLQPIVTLRCSIHQFAAYIAAVAAYLLGRLSTCGASLSAVRKAPVMLANQSLQSITARVHTPGCCSPVKCYLPAWQAVHEWC